MYLLKSNQTKNVRQSNCVTHVQVQIRGTVAQVPQGVSVSKSSYGEDVPLGSMVPKSH